MKGYKEGTILYVFPQTPDTIPYVAEDVTTIKVQLELLKAFKEENPDYADLMVGYNYNVMTILPKSWEDHLDDDITVDPDLAWSATGASVTIGATGNVYPTLTNTDNVPVTYSSSATGVATINPTGVVGLVGGGNSTISAAFEGDTTYNPKTVSYELTVNKGNPDLAWSATGASVTIGATGNVFPTLSNPHDVVVEYSSSDHNVADISDQYSGDIILIGEGTTTITASFYGDNEYNSDSASYVLTVESNNGESGGESGESEMPLPDAGFYWDPNTYDDYPDQSLGATLPVFTNPNGIDTEEISFFSDNDTVATVNSYGNITLTGSVGLATISAGWGGSESYSQTEAICSINVLQPESGESGESGESDIPD